ncbi:MAG: TIR domain-containing protein [Patescibacteria group bacterium]
MSANLTTFCLKELTDYAEFERLCDDVLSVSGYPEIEPLGGFKDKGRDAVHVDKKNTTTVFSYSVREDWQAKLFEDADKIVKHGHKCEKYVFVTTSDVTASERDSLKMIIKSKYGWDLEIYDIERLRNLLDAQHPEIKGNYPQVFRNDFFIDTTKKIKNNILISCDKSDIALADWLVRKLTSEGYSVWYERFKLLGGEKYPDDIDTAIDSKAACVISIYSLESLSNAEIVRQRSLAVNISKKQKIEFLIPLKKDNLPQDKLDAFSSQLVMIPFENWAKGLDQLLKKLTSLKIPKSVLDGKNIAANFYLNRGVITDKTEQLISNCLTVERIPGELLVSSPKTKIDYEELTQYFDSWAFRIIGEKLVSFSYPPSELVQKYDINIEKIEWTSTEKILEINPSYLVSELLRKSLQVYCSKKGLVYDKAARMVYFPSGLLKNDALTYTAQSGKINRINASGIRKYRRSASKEQYIYYLAPTFSISKSIANSYTILVRARIHITDIVGNALPGHQANGRRKDLCKDWWNREWLTRLLAICEFLAVDKKIVIGTNDDDTIIIDAEPIILSSPKGINETTLTPESFEREDTEVDSLEGDDA